MSLNECLWGQIAILILYVCASIQVSVQNDCDKCRKETTDNTELIEKKKAELSEVDVTATDAHLQMPLHTVYFGEVDQLLLQKNLKQEFICQSCPFQATSEDKLKIHSETSHDKKKKFACSECGKLYRHQSTAIAHKKTIHGSQLYYCDQCDYQTNTKKKLRFHKESAHLGIRYPCDQCPFQASQSGGLKNHIESQHSGLRFPCGNCEFKAKSKRNLRTHQTYVHELRRHKCKLCGVEVISVPRHMKTVHKQLLS